MLTTNEQARLILRVDSLLETATEWQYKLAISCPAELSNFAEISLYEAARYLALSKTHGFI